MKTNNIIIHFIARDKFTTGYINFFKLKMPEWEHHFFVSAEGFEVKPINNENVYYYHHDDELLEPDNFKLLNDCDKIIVSGVWDTYLLIRILSSFSQKTYLQFWGGDFYGYRFSDIPSIVHPRGILMWFRRRYLHHSFIQKCGGTINLISEDIEQLLKIFPNNAKHFTAQMPSDILEHYDFDSLKLRRKEGSMCKILAGNSAQSTNKHLEIFKKLSHLKDSDIEVISPLSYGDPEYRTSVIKLGHKIFGHKFKPIIDFIPKAKYIEFLASCDVAVFNNNRQAALGNIYLLMRLGKKIYLRENTAMWHHFMNKGACIFSIEKLSDIDLQSLVDMPKDGKDFNIRLAKEKFSGKSAREEWEKILND